MNTRKGVLAAFLSLTFATASLGISPDAAAAVRKKGSIAKQQMHHNKKLRATPTILNGHVPEVSSVIMVIDESHPEGFRVLNSDEPHARRTPASITKIMTLSLLFDAIESGEIKLNDKITLSDTDTGAGGTMLPAHPGTQITVQQAILAMVTRSANNVAVSVAEHLAGSEAAFAQRMNQKARKLGMNNTHFVNSHGMRDPNQYSSAYDLALLSHHIITQQSEHYHYFSTLSFIYGRATYNNHNRLMRIYGGMDGLKTGMTNHGWQLAASAERIIPANPEKNQPETIHRVIGVFMGGITKEQRNNCLGHLMDQAFISLGHNIDGDRFSYSEKACTSARHKPAPGSSNFTHLR
ncbi:MAG: D-alanyl-D-alanine carboxypeptidase [Micavibrio aeruginosavorus]|uniref:D-alanyl-D-alanine carboxypeptidase n=1 Tax=Micavibrio aeruginosavorus TaxID=349221 RepID=A0A7T5R2T2_9BACT|nr:MAG: D-alanyl-D-alanine carboxypeptidase [Micavibrio aeruginosavorus]